MAQGGRRGATGASLAGELEHLSNYLKRDMSEAAVLNRSAKRGYKRIFTSEEEKIVAGWVFRRREKFRPVHGPDVRVFILKAFGRSVSQ